MHFEKFFYVKNRPSKTGAGLGKYQHLAEREIQFILNPIKLILRYFDQKFWGIYFEKVIEINEKIALNSKKGSFKLTHFSTG